MQVQGVVIVAVVPACLPVTLSKTERAYAAAAVSLLLLLPWLSFMRLQQATKRRLHLQEPAARRQCVTMAVLLFFRRRRHRAHVAPSGAAGSTCAV